MAESADNPPAYPNTGNSAWGLAPTDGMSLRDRFAIGALSIIAAQYADGSHQFESALHVARNSYLLADAMLAVRGVE